MEAKKQCPTCLDLVEKLHEGAHVNPKWEYKRLKREHGNKLVMIDNRTREVSFHHQDSPKGKFWCEGCEQRSQLFDGYAANVLNNPASYEFKAIKRNFVVRGNNSVAGVLYEGFDSHRLQGFVISVILRQHLYEKYVEKNVERNGERDASRTVEGNVERNVERMS